MMRYFGLHTFRTALAGTLPQMLLFLLTTSLLHCSCGEQKKEDPNEPPVLTGNLKVYSFNVESGDASSAYLAQQIESIKGEALWGFSEVANQADADILMGGAAKNEPAPFKGVMGTTGAADRLFIAYNTGFLELVQSFELHDINVGGNVRAPLVAQFKNRESDLEFLFMVNHLYRTNTDARHQQARMLNAWGVRQTLPVVAVGDYNFDWDAANGETNHDLGYDLMTANGVFRWLRPTTLVKTQCDERFNSVLDFVFVSGSAQSWPATAGILFPEAAYCPDNATQSDHRPIWADLTAP